MKGFVVILLSGCVCVCVCVYQSFIHVDIRSVYVRMYMHVL